MKQRGVFLLTIVLGLLIFAPATLALQRDIVEPTYTVGLAISPDAKYIAFYTAADNVIPGDNNGFTDVYVHNRDTDNDGVFDEPGAVSTTNVSVALDGTQANGSSYFPVMNTTGRYVAFWSEATNLVADPLPNCTDPDNGQTRPCRAVYVFDRDSDNDGIFDEPGAVKNQRVSIASDGSTPVGDAYIKSISGDGRYVGYDSNSGGLVPGDIYNCGAHSCFDSFIYDRDTDNDGIFDEPGAIQTILVSKAADGSFGNAGSGYSTVMNPSGRFVAIRSASSNLDPDDPNSTWDIYVHDRDKDADSIFDESGGIDTQVVSVASDGTLGNDSSYEFPAIKVPISDTGRYVAYESKASNLVAGDTNGRMDVFYHDRDTDNDGNFDEPGAISTIILSPDGNDNSFLPAISGDGRYVAFTSAATNLIAGDTNGMRDTFVYDTQTGSIERVSVASDGTQGNGDSDSSAVSTDGRYIAFFSESDNLVVGDNNGVVDVFVHDQNASETVRIRMAGDEMMDNFGFEFESEEVNNLPEGWKGKGLTKDKMVCNKPDKTVAYIGQCAFRFKGSADENSQLSQKSNGAGLVQGDVLTVSVFAKAGNVEGFFSVDVKAKYVDVNLAPTKFSLPLSAGTYEYTQVKSDPVELLGPVSKLVLKVKFKGTSGKFYMDELRLVASSPSGGETSSGIIPLPPAQ